MRIGFTVKTSKRKRKGDAPQVVTVIDEAAPPEIRVIIPEGDELPPPKPPRR
jgi:hypothetical protein